MEQSKSTKRIRNENILETTIPSNLATATIPSPERPISRWSSIMGTQSPMLYNTLEFLPTQTLQHSLSHVSSEQYRANLARRCQRHALQFMNPTPTKILQAAQYYRSCPQQIQCIQFIVPGRAPDKGRSRKTVTDWVPFESEKFSL